MAVNTYWEYGTKPIKTAAVSPEVLLRGNGQGRFASFAVDLVGVIEKVGKGFGLSMQAATGKNKYVNLCVYGNYDSLPAMEAVKRLAVENNGMDNSTLVSLYATMKANGVSTHNEAPTLYANVEKDSNENGIHFRVSGGSVYDFIGNRTMYSTNVNIFYLSPYRYYTNGTGPNYITINIVLERLSLPRDTVLRIIKESGDSKMLRKEKQVQMNLPTL